MRPLPVSEEPLQRFVVRGQEVRRASEVDWSGAEQEGSSSCKQQSKGNKEGGTGISADEES